jgi:cell division protein ZapA (FtsZ GTPase activity inhibitor)
MEETTVTVTIMGRNYSLRVASDDREVLMSAAHRLDEMAGNFGQQFPSKDHQDHIAMAALLQEMKLQQLQQRLQNVDTKAIEQRLQQIDNMLSAADKATGQPAE